MELNEIQEESFVVLKKIKEICENYKIQYWLFAGTLLGAIRGGDFIPWDDDIDVCMPRKDYEKFIAICMNNPGFLKGFKLCYYKSCPNYAYPITRLSRDGFYFDSYIMEYGLGVFVDIYPLDGFKEDSNLLESLSKKKRTIGRMIAKKQPPKFSKIKFIILSFLQIFYRIIPLKKRLEDLDLSAQKYDFESNILCGNIIWEPYAILKRRWFDGTLMWSFHGEQFPIPKHYNELLHEMYGNYLELPPIDQQVPNHDYKMYRLEG